MPLERAALLIHDVVNDFRDEADTALPGVIANIRALIDAARKGGVPVVFAVPDRGTPGCDVVPELPVRPEDTIVRKPRYGAFFGTTLAQRLRQKGQDTVVVCGISLAGGVETTVRDAHNADLRSILVSDACLCRPVPDQGWGAVSQGDVAKVVFSIVAQRFGRVVTTAQACREFVSP
jgi:nicotinamidase-related amidase